MSEYKADEFNNDNEDNFYLDDVDNLRSLPLNLEFQSTTFHDDLDQEDVFRSMPVGVHLETNDDFINSLNSDSYLSAPKLSTPCVPKMSGGSYFIAPSFGAYGKEASSPALKFMSTSVTSADRPLALPPPPFFLEDHFFSRVSLKILTEAITKSFATHQIDALFNAKKYKWRSKGYGNCSSVDFRVQIFVTAPGFTVEVQRRNGDVIQFRHVFNSLLATLSADGVVCDSNGTSCIRGTKQVGLKRPSLPPPLVDFELESRSEENDDSSGLKPLLSMLSSNFCDVQQQAALSLAQMARHQSSWSAFTASADAVPLLVNATGSRDEEVSRCASTALASLASCPEAAQRIATSGGVRALSNAAATAAATAQGQDRGQLPAFQLLRNSVLALSRLAVSPSAQSVVRDQAAPQLLRLQMFPDETVRSFALEATSVLAAAVNVR